MSGSQESDPTLRSRVGIEVDPHSQSSLPHLLLTILKLFFKAQKAAAMAQYVPHFLGHSPQR